MRIERELFPHNSQMAVQLDRGNESLAVTRGREKPQVAHLNLKPFRVVETHAPWIASKVGENLKGLGLLRRGENENQFPLRRAFAKDAKGIGETGVEEIEGNRIEGRRRFHDPIPEKGIGR